MGKFVSVDKWLKDHLKELIRRAEEERENMQPGSLLGDHNRPMPYWEPES